MLGVFFNIYQNFTYLAEKNKIKKLTKKLCQPLWLVVVLDSDSAGVEEDEDNDQPEPPLLFTHPANPELELFQCQHQT